MVWPNQTSRTTCCGPEIYTILYYCLLQTRGALAPVPPLFLCPCTMCCIPCIPLSYHILCTAYYVVHATCCILHTLYHILHAAYHLLYTMCCTLCTLHYLYCSIHVYCILCTTLPYCILCTSYYILHNRSCSILHTTY